MGRILVVLLAIVSGICAWEKAVCTAQGLQVFPGVASGPDGGAIVW